MMHLFLPETVLLAITILLLCFTLIKEETAATFLQWFMPLAGLALIAASFYSLHANGQIFHSTYRVDLLSQGFKLLFSLCFFVTILFSDKMLSIKDNRRVEYFLILCSATLGMMMMPSAVDILTLYISMELSSYSLYLLVGIHKDKKNAEASVKYYLLGAITSGVMLWGFSLIAGLSGTTSLFEITALLPSLIHQPAYALGVVLVSMAFFFKLSAFPMHFWAPDVYESAALPVVSFIATASKAAAVSILIRFLLLSGQPASYVLILGALAFISMTIGNCVALVQTDVKRLLAYSSVAQAGYILVGLLANSFEGYSMSFFYAVAYVLMNTGAFLVTLVLSKAIGRDNPKLSDFDGLAERSPFMALLLLLSLLSLAGIPPLVGFTGKWVLFSAAMDKGHWFLVLWAVLNSVVSLFYYLTLVKHAYLEKPKWPGLIEIPLHLKALGLFIFCSLVFLGIFPNLFITFAQNAAAASLRVF
jgi:NADH-quinone oxidoreductase subunit N